MSFKEVSKLCEGRHEDVYLTKSVRNKGPSNMAKPKLQKVCKWLQEGQKAICSVQGRKRLHAVDTADKKRGKIKLIAVTVSRTCA